MKMMWKQKFRMERDIMISEWTTMRKVNKTHSDWEHLFITKYATGILATKINMVRRKNDDDETCPCCDEREDMEHILECSALPQEKAFTSAIELLHQQLTDLTSWEIQGAIIEIVTSFRQHRPPNIHHNWSTSIANTVRDQHDLGQRAFFADYGFTSGYRNKMSFRKHRNHESMG